ncbi:septum formation protein Maf [candidate division WOR-3 bacterium]|nr:septum formation protein Maf [candidate division WOR-3 bacterium]
MRFILASASPRREELLRTLIPSFDVIKSGIDESLIDDTNAVEFALKASEAKAESVALNIKKGVIISADTVVSLNGSIIGKPQNERDAYDILSRLSGSEHVVITSLCIIVKNSRGLKKISDYEETIVKMKELKEEEIISYLSSSNWEDKAGAYAIQENGDKFIEYIIGDYHNVVGLPVKKLKKLLTQLISSRAIKLSSIRNITKT